MKTQSLLARSAALTALVALSACGGLTEPDQVRAPSPYDLYALGTVYDCGALPQPDVRSNTENHATATLGCAHQSNITAMVADPEDLHRPRAMTPADDAARQRVRDAYRTGQDTSTGGQARGATALIQ